jgi:peptidoglycan hydrolase CwlO-like protein
MTFVRIFIVLLLACAVFPLMSLAQSSTDVETRKAQLEQQLAEIEREMAKQQAVLDQKTGERKTLESAVAILNAEISKAKLSIRARQIKIDQLTGQIGKRQNTIVSLDERLRKEKESLGELIRKSYELSNYSAADFMLSGEDLSDALQDLDTFAAIKEELADSFDFITTTKGATIAEKEVLEVRREDESELKRLQEEEKKKIEAKEREKAQLLKTTKGQESEYQKILNTTKKTAAQIRAELFALRDTKAISFGAALEYANFASSKTGVRPALLLGVLKQETDLGKNLGTGTWTKDMHPTRDVPIFPYITANLGLKPDDMPVSKKPSYGWGGAMGPGQFIPSTWACYGGYINTSTGKCGKNPDGSYAGPWEYDASKDRVRKLLGKNSPSNPWEPRDAFMATAMLMMDNGAAAGTRAAERLAALRYFAGWTNASNPAYAFYGDGVLGHADYFQQQIDILKGN